MLLAERRALLGYWYYWNCKPQWMRCFSLMHPPWLF